MHPCAAPHPSERPDRSYNCCASRARRQAHRRRRNCRVSHGSRPHEIRVLRLDLTLSVCTGALMLGKGGAARRACGDDLSYGVGGAEGGRAEHSAASRRALGRQRLHRRLGGVSAGIDMSLYVVGKLLGAVRPTRRPTTWGRSTGTVCRWKNRNERREARTEKTRWANFPIVDGARGRDQGRPGGYVPELHDAGLVFVGCVDTP